MTSLEMMVHAVPPYSIEVQPVPYDGRLNISSVRSGKLTWDIWFSDRRLYLMASLEVKKKINKPKTNQLKRDASSQLPSLSSDPVCCPCIPTCRILILKFIPNLYQAYIRLYMCVFFLLFVVFPIPQLSHSNP